MGARILVSKDRCRKNTIKLTLAIKTVELMECPGRLTYSDTIILPYYYTMTILEAL